MSAVGNMTDRMHDQITDLKEQVKQLEAERDRAFSVLEMMGVPRERARSIDNGLMVLEQRLRRESLYKSKESI